MLTPEIVIADTSCLINLERIGALTLLEEVFESIVVTEEIAAEFGKPLPVCFEIREAPTQATKNMQRLGLHEGESSALALALELEGNCLLILDDQMARREAKELNLRFIGLLGVLLRAKSAKLIDRVGPYIEHLRRVGFRLHEKVINQVLRQAGEL